MDLLALAITRYFGIATFIVVGIWSFAVRNNPRQHLDMRENVPFVETCLQCVALSVSAGQYDR